MRTVLLAVGVASFIGYLIWLIVCIKNWDSKIPPIVGMVLSFIMVLSGLSMIPGYEGGVSNILQNIYSPIQTHLDSKTTGNKSTETKDSQTSIQGSRSNPYHFGEEISFSILYDGNIIEYSVEFCELIRGLAVRNLLMYPSKYTNDDFVVRAKVAISGSYDDVMGLSMTPYFVDKSFNAVVANTPAAPVQTANGKNNFISVYCGGSYDIIFTPNVEIDKDFAYIELHVNNFYVDGQIEHDKSLWIEVPTESELESGQFYYTGRGFEPEYIVGCWSTVESTMGAADDFLIFYEDGTFEMDSGYSVTYGTWEKSSIEQEVKSNNKTMVDEFLSYDPYFYRLTFNKRTVSVVVCDDPALGDKDDVVMFGDGEKDILGFVAGSSNTKVYERAQ